MRKAAIALVAVGVLSIPLAADTMTREYLLGDIDGIHYGGAGSVDDVYVDPNVLAYLKAVAPSEPNDHFDVINVNNNVPFTFTFPLAPGEQVLGAELTLGLRATDPLVSTDEFAIMNSDATQQWKYWFQDLGWLPLSSDGVSVRTVDLGNVLGDSYLWLLQEGKINLYVTDDCAVDYANLSIQAVPGPSSLVCGAMALTMLGAYLRKRRGPGRSHEPDATLFVGALPAAGLHDREDSGDDRPGMRRHQRRRCLCKQGYPPICPSMTRGREGEGGVE